MNWNKLYEKYLIAIACMFGQRKLVSFAWTPSAMCIAVNVWYYFRNVVVIIKIGLLKPAMYLVLTPGALTIVDSS